MKLKSTYVVHGKWKIIFIADIVGITTKNSKGSTLRLAIIHPGFKTHSEEILARKIRKYAPCIGIKYHYYPWSTHLE